MGPVARRRWAPQPRGMSTTRCLDCTLALHDAHDLDLDPPGALGDLDLDQLAEAEMAFVDAEAMPVGRAA